ncbi:ABC transporter ATP-binding protein [Paenibacillus apiarius]|uniref:ABC transporter ATP-binding protein n=1 Tax=Paenibacillus apiarius TaxID=46240 RepID=A0ABT4DX35_9BACL|nr:ABC transporter ATP-binding protein [Paenibacillus apiarius]MCY9516834.1 ABC transporter ATP-binding protein [Paenibacillus apiarius]MCY9521927.1 ABC transporter ATP-binding protein [Paenibacillus apiarius]MCY9550473.1 ABC transporter ATP-binding protein [Paenibacillus apiarius]MCY9559878.1 ABC transporter ATP-binding protein [Paenibacillus apiarius]MCY9683438.1 ABC transporter ATP-binding protein [Paenibacillus apiarius]
MSHVVEVRELTKSYGNVNAVQNVSFVMKEDKIYGLLGRNGAGKTTIMHLMTAQLFPTSGSIRLFGEDPFENNRVLSQVCFIKESQKYPDTFRIKDVLAVSAFFFPEWDSELASRLLEDFRLPPRRIVKKLSRGMLSALGVVVGLASRAPLTLFDEPYLGLDAVARSIFYDRLIEDYTKHPRTIVLSTHLIDEVSRILEHIIVIDDGKLLIDEDADSLRERAFTAVGTASKVERFMKERQVLQRDTFGALASVTIMGPLSPEERKQAAVLDIELASVSLQKLIVHLTGNHPSGREGGDER